MNFSIFLKGIFFLFSLTFFSSFFAQIQPCLQHVIHNEMMQNQEYAEQFHINQEILRQQEIILQNNPELHRGTVYKIPIVFHVLHNGGPENISREQILDGLRIMNRDYRKLNADTATVHADFTDRIADIEIEFVLATKAPNGDCFSGITRTQSALSFVSSSSQGSSQVNAIVSGNDVYNGQWPGNKYLNVFICGDIGGAAGYTTQPWNTGMTNGIWVLHDYVGSIGTGSDGRDRTLTHESGHWLNLPHTWGDSNEPGLASNCNMDDGVSDTPNCVGVDWCNLNENTCGPRANVENYMDYSYCNKMFTEGQKTKMRAAIISGVGGRSNVWTAGNLTATGADGILTLCEAEFTSDKTTICAGEQIQFTDLSFNAVSTWNWNFEGGIADATNISNPIVTYNGPGFYSVTLSATHNGTNKVVTKTGYIRVLSASEPIPFMEGFENQTSFVNNPNWEITNPQNNQAFNVVSGVALTGNKSVKLENFAQLVESDDELIASPVDLSSITTNATLSFRFSYRKKATSNNERLQVYGSNNCGTTWSLLKNISGTQLSSIVQTTAFTPTSVNDWTTVHVTNIFSSYWIENFRYKFKFSGDGGNNIYLDNINVYSGTSSDDLILADTDNDGQTNDVDTDDDNDGVSDVDDDFPYDSTETLDTDNDGIGNNTDNDDDNDTVLDVDDPEPLNPNVPFASVNNIETNQNEITLVPNPTDKDFMVEFSSKTYSKTSIQIFNTLGEIVYQHSVNANPGKNIVFMDSHDLKSGLYLLKLNSETFQGTKRLIIK